MLYFRNEQLALEFADLKSQYVFRAQVVDKLGNQRWAVQVLSTMNQKGN